MSTLAYQRVACNNYVRNRPFCLSSTPLGYQTHRALYRHGSPISPYQRTLTPIGAISEETEVTYKTDSAEVEKFDWFKNWWPVQAVDNLPTDRPYPIQLLGKHYVVWKGKSGQWIAMDDECPHRMAPLSEGRIEKDGNLLCSYHAWRFNESGKCVKIPHAEDEKAHSVACSSPRSAVQTYPCKTRGALLWMWPDRSISAFDDSEKAVVPIDDDIADYLEQGSIQGTVHPYIRYLPYSFDVLMENLVDPSHFTVSHHSLFPSISRYNARPIHGKLTEGLGKIPAYAALRVTPENPFFKWSQTDFRKPGVVYILTAHQTDKKTPSSKIFLTATPVSSGISMVVSTGMNGNLKENTKEANFLQGFFNKIKVLIAHIKFQSAIFDGDSVFLRELDKKIKAQGTNFKANKEYYVPTSADLLVMAFRKWFETEGGHGAAYGGDKLHSNGTELTRQEMLDRYEQHTKHCKICRESLKTIEIFIDVLKFLSLGSLFVGSLILIRATTAQVVEWKTVLKNLLLWTSIIVGSAASYVRRYLKKEVIPLFYFQDWVHAEKN
eukprot:g8974.t1